MHYNVFLSEETASLRVSPIPVSLGSMIAGAMSGRWRRIFKSINLFCYVRSTLLLLIRVVKGPAKIILSTSPFSMKPQFALSI